MSRILLVDISGIAYAIWHVSGKEPDQDYVSKATVAKVHELANGFDHVAICCDGPKNFRKEISPEYKANRESNEVVKHQLRLAQEQLAEDGFAVWKAEGFEADDLIASAVKLATANADVDEVMIASADKDLLALVYQCEDFAVRVHSPASGKTYGLEEVRAKFGVYPEQMRDLLCLMGDKSDNVPGVPGIGQVKGADLLNKHGTLAEIYAKIGDSCSRLGLTPSTFTALKENAIAVDMARKLITLRDDVPLPFDDIFKPRTPKTQPVEFEQEEPMETTVDGEVIEEKPAVAERQETTAQVVDIKPAAQKEKPPMDDRPASAALTVVDWEKELEPRSSKGALAVANALFASRLFQGFGSPEAVFSTVMLGRELGLGTMGAIRGIHLIETKTGKRHSLSADLMAALVLQSGKAKYFDPVELESTHATYTTHRVGSAKPFTLTFKLEEAEKAGLIKKDGNWEKWAIDMCKARAVARLARAIYPDVCFGLYVKEELEAA